MRTNTYISNSVSAPLCTQLHDEDICQFTLEEVYKTLHTESKIIMTVRDRPSVKTYQFRSEMEMDQLVSCLCDDNGNIRVDEEKYVRV